MFRFFVNRIKTLIIRHNDPVTMLNSSKVATFNANVFDCDLISFIWFRSCYKSPVIVPTWHKTATLNLIATRNGSSKSRCWCDQQKCSLYAANKAGDADAFRASGLTSVVSRGLLCIIVATVTVHQIFCTLHALGNWCFKMLRSAKFQLFDYLLQKPECWCSFLVSKSSAKRRRYN